MGDTGWLSDDAKKLSRTKVHAEGKDAVRVVDPGVLLPGEPTRLGRLDVQVDVAVVAGGVSL